MITKILSENTFGTDVRLRSCRTLKAYNLQILGKNDPDIKVHHKLRASIFSDNFSRYPSFPIMQRRYKNSHMSPNSPEKPAMKGNSGFPTAMTAMKRAGGDSERQLVPEIVCELNPQREEGNNQTRP